MHLRYFLFYIYNQHDSDFDSLRVTIQVRFKIYIFIHKIVYKNKT